MDLKRYAPLRAAGATWKEIAAEVGVDPRTVKKYLSPDAPAGAPAAPSRAGTVPRKIDAVSAVIDAWLAADLDLRASVIHERLVADYGFDGHYQRVKTYVAAKRGLLRAEADAAGRPTGLHRRFEVVAGAQAQVDWGEEGAILLGSGIGKVYSFHMTLSYSRDPFCCFVTSQDLGTFFDCHRRAFAHFGGVPASIVYDRTKTVVRRHVAPGRAVPLHPEAAAFADHYGFAVDVLAAYRPTGKGRVERQVAIVRDHVLAGRTFTNLDEMNAAFAAWVPIRRAQVHRTHGEPIGVRAQRDHAALQALPELPYLVCDRHLRRLGRDCLISFAGSSYSIPARAADGRCSRAGQRVEVRVSADELTVHRLPADGPSLGWPAIPAPTAPGSWWSIRRTGRSCPTGTPARSPSTRPPTRPTAKAADPTSRTRCAAPSRWPRCRSPPGRCATTTPRPVYRHRGAAMSELVSSRIHGYADRLTLPHLADNLDTLVSRAEADTMGYRDFIDLILGEEVGLREGRRFRAALKLSGLPHHKTVDEFDFAFQPDLDIRRVRDLATLAFVPARSNIALLGPPGVGKTHLAVALAVAACQAGHSIYFTSLDDCVRQLRAADAAGRFAKKLQTYLRPAVLVLDEVGYLPCDRTAANMVFQLVSRRYERGSIILTSNKAFSEWGQIFSDDVLATAILDRLLHHCDVISITGASYRLKDRGLAPPPGSGEQR